MANRIEVLRARYDGVRAEMEPWLSEAVGVYLDEWSSGAVARDYFGQGANSLDALCLASAWEKATPLALANQVAVALEEGHSWNEVAAALGVSRQAAKKRWERWVD